MKISLICTCKCDWIAGWTWETEASYQASTIKSLYDPPMNMKLVRVTLHFFPWGPGWKPYSRGGGWHTHTNPPLPTDVIGADSSWPGRPDWQTTTVQTAHTKRYAEEFQWAAPEKKRQGEKKKNLERTWINQPFWFRGSPWKALICSCWHVACAAWAHWEVRHQLTQYTHVIEL